MMANPLCYTVDYNEMEPGIRGAVKWLRDLGIKTTQSCEGHEDRAAYVLSHYNRPSHAVVAGEKVRQMLADPKVQSELGLLEDSLNVEVLYDWEGHGWLLLIAELEDGTFRKFDKFSPVRP